MIVIYIISVLAFIGLLWSTSSYIESTSKKEINKWMFVIWILSYAIIATFYAVLIMVNFEQDQMIKGNYKCPELERVDNVYRIK